MSKIRIVIALSLVFLLVAIALTARDHIAFADDHHEDKGRGRISHRRHDRKHYRSKRETLGAFNNHVYLEQCDSCHYLYHPGLLPSSSWVKILNTSSDHFGEDLDLESGVKDELKAFFKGNSSETNSSKISKRITRDAGRQTALTITRITKTPYIKGQHRGLRKKIFKRASIGSFSNCSGCHVTAKDGNFEEDNVVIPRR